MAFGDEVIEEPPPDFVNAGHHATFWPVASGGPCPRPAFSWETIKRRAREATQAHRSIVNCLLSWRLRLCPAWPSPPAAKLPRSKAKGADRAAPQGNSILTYQSSLSASAPSSGPESSASLRRPELSRTPFS